MTFGGDQRGNQFVMCIYTGDGLLICSGLGNAVDNKRDTKYQKFILFLIHIEHEQVQGQLVC